MLFFTRLFYYFMWRLLFYYFDRKRSTFLVPGLLLYSRFKFFPFSNIVENNFKTQTPNGVKLCTTIGDFRGYLFEYFSDARPYNRGSGCTLGQFINLFSYDRWQAKNSSIPSLEIIMALQIYFAFIYLCKHRLKITRRIFPSKN